MLALYTAQDISPYRRCLKARYFLRFIHIIYISNINFVLQDLMYEINIYNAMKYTYILL